MPLKSNMKRKSKTEGNLPVPTKIAKTKKRSVQRKEVLLLPKQYNRGPGNTYTHGTGDTGQLGLGPDILERSRPTKVPGLENVVQISAGGMHTLCLTGDGTIFSFGCNDEGALGRLTIEEDSETVPGSFHLDGKVIQITTGDSHSAALLESGQVYAWGTFRDSHGSMGLTPDGPKPLPTLLDIDEKVVQIASGSDHLLLLTEKGTLFTCGCGEQGQLGRLRSGSVDREGDIDIGQLLYPSELMLYVKGKKIHFNQVWATTSGSFAQEIDTGKMFVFGLNNYNQLGSDGLGCHFYPVMSPDFSFKSWTKISGGQHHTLALDTEGRVFSLGRKEYGRLGLGENSPDVASPTLIPALEKKRVKDIACGSSVSFAVTEDGHVFSWGMGTCGQLGTGSEDDVYVPTMITAAQLQDKVVVCVSAGGQHTALLATDNPSQNK